MKGGRGRERMGREKERERDIDVRENLGMCPGWGLNPQPLTRDQTCDLLVYGMTLQPTEQPVQGDSSLSLVSLFSSMQFLCIKASL